MQNDPKKRNQTGGGQPAPRKTSFVGKTAAERRAERRGESSTTDDAKATGTQNAIGAGNAANRTLDRRAERERERSRQRLLTTVGIIALVVVVIVGLVIVTQTPDDAPVPETARVRYEDMLQSRNTDGYPLLGNATAPVVVTLYSGFDCDPCKTFHDAIIDPLLERVRDDRIALEFVPLYGQGTVTNGQGAAIAALCAAEQNRFWAFQDMLYSWIGQFPNNLTYRNNRINGGVANLGLDGGAYNGCRGSSRPGEVLERARLEAAGLLNFSGAPTTAINGVVPMDDENQPITDVAEVLAAIDEAVARVTSDAIPVEPVPEMTPEAGAEATPEATGVIEPTPEATSSVEPTAEPLTAAEATPAVEPTAEPVTETTAGATIEAVIEPTPEVTPEATPSN